MVNGRPDYQVTSYIKAGVLTVDTLEAGTITSITNPLNMPSTVEHFSGTVDSTASTINFSSTSYSIYLDNKSWITLYVSFDEGANWYSIAPKTSLNADLSINSMQMKAGTEISGESVAYQMIVSE